MSDINRAQFVFWLTLLGTPVVFGQAPSEYVNRQLPAWLKLSGEERLRFETVDNNAFKTGDNSYLLQRLRLDLTVTPLPWLKMVVQAQDSRVFGTNVRPVPSSQQDPVDLRIAYLQFGGITEGRFGLRVGRQSLDFAEGRLIADPNWSNVGRTFEAVRVTLRSKRVQLHAFSGMVDRVVTDGFDERTPGERLHGAFLSFDGAGPGTAVLQPYVLWRLATGIKTERSGMRDLDEKTLGMRWAGRLSNGFDYGVEAALQRGSTGSEPLAAWAGHWTAGQALTAGPRPQRVYGEFNYGSGDSNSKDGQRGGFDILFPSSHDKFGASDQFCWTNLMHARAGYEYRVKEALSLGTAYNSYWLASTRDGLYASGKIVVAGDGRPGRHVGHGIDLQGQWKLARATQVQAVVSHVFAGEFLQRAGRPSFNSVVIALIQRL